LGQARVVIEEEPDSDWSSCTHDFHGSDPVLNRVWAMEVQDPEETTQNERFEEYWRALAPHRVKIFL
jgi:hypothetical protein